MKATCSSTFKRFDLLSTFFLITATCHALIQAAVPINAKNKLLYAFVIFLCDQDRNSIGLDFKRFHEDTFLDPTNMTFSKVNRSFIFALVSHLIIQKLVFNLSSASLTFE